MPLTSQEFWKLYETLPQELKDASFSEETGDIIYAACERNEVMASLPVIVDAVGEVLLGILPPEEFEKRLVDIKIPPEKAKKIAREISRFLFVPNQQAIAALHIPQKESVYIPIKETAAPAADAPSSQSKQRAKQRPSGKDAYRESIE